MNRRLVLAMGAIAVAPLASAQGLAPREGWRVLPTPHAFPVLIERLEKAIASNQMGLVTRASASEGAKAQGITIAGNAVIGVYRNDFARRMLKASVAAGIEAPIRFYVTEGADGNATLSYKTPSAVFAPYVAEAEPDLRVLAGELDAIFAKIADESVRP